MRAEAELLAVYGSLLRGMGAQDTLGWKPRLAYLGECVLPGRLYDLGSYPGLRPGASRTRGELFSLADAALLDEIDAYEGYRPDDPSVSLFVRRRLRLLHPAREAWVYCYERSVAERREVPGGDWRVSFVR